MPDIKRLVEDKPLEKILMVKVTEEGIHLNTPEDGLSDLDIMGTIGTLIIYLKDQGIPKGILAKTLQEIVESGEDES